MSDGISDGRQARDLDDILTTGAAWITERELSDLGADLKQCRANWFRLRAAVERSIDALDRGSADGIRDDLVSALWPTKA